MTRYEEIAGRLRSDPQRWLVTGVAGFIGSHLLETLLRLDQHVVGLDNFSTGNPSNLNAVLASVGPTAAARFNFIDGDIRDAYVCRVAMDRVRFVLHEAALGSVPRSMADPAATHATNVDGFVNVLLASRDAGVRRVVFASSSSVYGDDRSSPKLEGQLGHPLSPYAASKLVDEIYADTFRRTHDIDSVGLRYFNVFGPRQDPNGPYAAVIPRWTENLLSGTQSVVYGDGTTSRDFCFVENVARANLLAACAKDEEIVPRVFNVACGESTTLLELFAGIRERVAEFHPEAREAELEYQPPRAGDVRHSLASIERARACLGYEPAFDVGTGLDATVAWYAAQSRRESAPEISRTRASKERHELHSDRYGTSHSLPSAR